MQDMAKERDLYYWTMYSAVEVKARCTNVAIQELGFTTVVIMKMLVLFALLVLTIICSPVCLYAQNMWHMCIVHIYTQAYYITWVIHRVHYVFIVHNVFKYHNTYSLFHPFL